MLLRGLSYAIVTGGSENCFHSDVNTYLFIYSNSSRLTDNCSDLAGSFHFVLSGIK